MLHASTESQTQRHELNWMGIVPNNDSYDKPRIIYDTTLDTGTKIAPISKGSEGKQSLNTDGQDEHG